MKYALLEGTRVKNTIISSTTPSGTEGTDFVPLSGDTLVSVNYRYDSASDTFIGPLSYVVDNQGERDNKGNILMGDSIRVTCSFDRSCESFTTSDLTIEGDGLGSISDIVLSSGDNTLYFTLSTGSLEASLADVSMDDGEEIIVNFTKQHPDSYGFKWDLPPIEFKYTSSL